MRNYKHYSEAVYDAWKLDKSWVAMDASGEIWAGECHPEYHEYLPVWLWPFDEFPVKLGYIFPIKNWRECKWRNV